MTNANYESTPKTHKIKKVVCFLSGLNYNFLMLYLLFY